MNAFNLNAEAITLSNNMTSNMAINLSNSAVGAYHLPSENRLPRVIANTQILACESSLDEQQTGHLTYQAANVLGMNELLMK